MRTHIYFIYIYIRILYKNHLFTKQIPVYSGAQRPLIDSYESDNFFGFDGFGDFNFTKEIIATIQTKNASVLLADLVKQYPGINIRFKSSVVLHETLIKHIYFKYYNLFLDEIILVSLAPLTNIAMTVLSEPHFLHLLKQHIIMGSSIKKNSDKLNQSDQIEFNFKQDPESNWIALNNINKPSTIVPIDTIHTNLISKVIYLTVFMKIHKLY
jgi:inosine-uridine nucleoside N-ribohydrolase